MLSQSFFPWKCIWLLNRLRLLLNFLVALYLSLLAHFIPSALLWSFAWIPCVDPPNRNIRRCCNRLLEKQLRTAKKPKRPTFSRPIVQRAEKQALSLFSRSFFSHGSDGPHNQFSLPPTPISWSTWYTKTKTNPAPATLCLQVRHAQHEAPFYRRGLFDYASALLPWTVAKSHAIWATIANICCGAQHSPPQAAGQWDPLRPKSTRVSKKREKGNGKRRGVSDGNNPKHPGDSDDEGSSNERSQSNDDAAEDKARLWACLYYASDPHTHFRCLGKYWIKRFPDVVQHLERCHVLQESFYCPKCWQQQTSKADRDSHVRDCSSPNLPRPERLYDHELGQIKEMLRSLRGCTDEHKWFAMWDMIFPGCPRPHSPYVEQGMAEPAGVLRRNNEPALHAEMPRLLGELGVQLSPQATTRFLAEVAAIAFQVPSLETQPVGLGLIGDQAAPTGPSTGVQSGHAPPSHSQSLAGDQFHYGNQPLYEGSTTTNPATDQWQMFAGSLMPGLLPAEHFAANLTGHLRDSISPSQSENLSWLNLDLPDNLVPQSDELATRLANAPQLQMTGPNRDINPNAILETPTGGTQASSLPIRPHGTVYMPDLTFNSNAADTSSTPLNLAPDTRPSNAPPAGPRSTLQRGNRNGLASQSASGSASGAAAG